MDLRCIGTPACFPPFLQRETTFVTANVFACLDDIASPTRGFILKRKDLLLGDQILSVRVDPMKRWGH